MTDAVAHRRAEAYVAAVNASDEAPAEAFRTRHTNPAYAASVPREVFIDFFAQQRRVTGGLELEDVRVVSPRRAEALLRDRIYGARHGLTLDFDDTAEALVSEFDPDPAPLWAPPAPRDRTTAQIATDALALVRRGCEAQVFSGAVLVARGRTVLATEACGYANRRYDVPNRPDTRFNLASINKMFTAVAVMQLAEAGKLSLDDPLSRHLDETWIAPDVGRTITLRHLLTHTSGLGSFLNETWNRSSRRLYSDLGDYKPLVRDERPAFAPGSAFQYSNTGMLLLGAVIEKVSGESYFDYVRDHVFAPSGMSSAGYLAMNEPVPNLAMGYGPAPGSPYGWRENTPNQLFRGTPAGGGYATVEDLHRFAVALQEGRLVSDASRAVLWRDNAPNDYGGGFTVETTAAGKVVGHDGIFSGVSTRFRIYLDSGYVVVILGNQDFAAPGLDEALTELIARGR
ncbi:serine hydrolase domain-containing protein [Phenylobacterium sp. VNQ135]|uniref:serine hydrolase domain-containing protein n=1 Tax=Phenylobacterium sp. VNQ135 TaxID=3400922 RepID=UPI003C014A51